MNEPFIMKHKLDPRRPTQPTAAQRKRLQAVADKPDADIDYSDIPALSPEFWATHRPASGEPKAQVTLRIDRDVLDYFKDGGAGLPDANQCCAAQFCRGAFARPTLSRKGCGANPFCLSPDCQPR